MTLTLAPRTQTLTRSQRAMQIERRTSRQWSVARIGVTMPSQSKPGVTYNVSLDACSCPDHQCRLIVCKHMLACRLMFGRQSAREKRNAA